MAMILVGNDFVLTPGGKLRLPQSKDKLKKVTNA